MRGLGTTFAISINGNGNGTTASLIITTDRERGKRSHRYLNWSERMRPCLFQHQPVGSKFRTVNSQMCFWVFLLSFFLCVVLTVWLSALLSAPGAAKNPSCWLWCNPILWVHPPSPAFCRPSLKYHLHSLVTAACCKTSEEANECANKGRSRSVG